MAVILMTKLKNTFRVRLALYQEQMDAAGKSSHIAKDLEYSLSNISINGDKRGCRGFICNPLIGSYVYVTLEVSAGFGETFLYRYALNDKDYGSNGIVNGNNRYAFSLTEIVDAIIRLLASGVGIPKDKEEEFFVQKIKDFPAYFEVMPESKQTETTCWAAVMQDKSLAKHVRIKSKKILMFVGDDCLEYIKTFYDDGQQQE